MSEGKLWTHSQVFSRALCVVLSPLVLVLFYLGNKYVCHCWSLKNSSLIGIVWPVWACTPLSLSVLSWKVPLFSLLQHPPPPCVRLEYYNVCGSGNGVSECCFPHPVGRNKTRRLEWYPALLLSDNSFTPHLQRRAPALQDTIVSVTSTPTNTKSQDGNKDQGPQQAFWVPLVCSC